jgi:hypothetical protein
MACVLTPPALWFPLTTLAPAYHIDIPAQNLNHHRIGRALRADPHYFPWTDKQAT